MSADEYELQDELERALVEEFGSRVRREVCLPSGRICDFVVDVPVVDIRLAIEVEHNTDPGEVADDVIHGAGQAILYASELKNAAPMVVTNPASDDSPELETIRERVPVVEWSS